MSTPEENLSDAIAQQERDRLKAVAKREKLERRRQPYTAYYGTDSATGQVRVKPLGADGVLSVQGLSNVQPSMGQYGRGFRVGADFGAVRKPEIEVFGRTDKYPFKTIGYSFAVTPGGTFFGGDRPAQLISSQPFAPGLSNTGGKNGFVITLANGPVLNFFNSSSFATPFRSLNLQTPSGAIEHKGDNWWPDQSPPMPNLSQVRRTVSGNPPLAGVVNLGLSLESGNDFAYNFAVAYDDTATLNGSSWAPYNAGPLPYGSETWSVSTAYNGVTQSSPSSPYLWQNLTRTESRGGDRTYPIRVHIYSADGINAVQGVGRRTRTGSTTATHSRAQDFSQMTLNQSRTDFVLAETSALIPIVGNQSIEWVGSRNSQNYVTTMSDVRSVAGGTHATYTFNETQNFVSLTKNPLTKMLKGANAAICCVAQAGNNQDVVIEEIRNVTSQERTTVIRPSMQNPILVGTSEYLVSAVRSAVGSLGGWYSGGSYIPGTPGEPPPSNEKNYREGNLLEDNPTTGAPVTGDSYYPISIRYAAFDSPGAYSDNFTGPDVFCEYTYAEAKSIRGNIWDIGSGTLNWSANFNWDYTEQRTTTSTTTYQLETDYKLLLTEETLTIPAEQTVSAIAINATSVTAPEGAGLLTVSSLTSVATAYTSRTREWHRVETRDRHFVPGVISPATYHTAHRYTSDDLSMVGKRAEVYLLTGTAIKRWQGVVISYDGDRSPNVPPAFRTISANETESNTFVGPYRQAIAVKQISIDVEAPKTVKHCPWPLADGKYTIVLNSDFAFEALIDPLWCNLVAGSGDSLAKMYVASSGYKSGQENYAAVWEFVRSDGGARAVKREDVKGKTKKGITGETLQAVQYFPL